jgi:hypothetical protein
MYTRKFCRLGSGKDNIAKMLQPILMTTFSSSFLLDKGGEPSSTRSHYSIYQLMFRPESSLHPSAITTSYIYTSSSPSISSKVGVLRDRENFQTLGKFPSPPPHLTLKHLCFIVFEDPDPECLKSQIRMQHWPSGFLSIVGKHKKDLICESYPCGCFLVQSLKTGGT